MPRRLPPRISPGSIFNRAFGLRQVPIALEEFLDLFRDAGTTAWFIEGGEVVAPLGATAVDVVGVHAGDVESVRPSDVEGLVIRPVGSGEASDWVELFIAGFEVEPDLAAAWRAFQPILAGGRGYHQFIGELDGRVVAAGALMTHRRVGWLGAGTVLPECARARDPAGPDRPPRRGCGRARLHEGDGDRRCRLDLEPQPDRIRAADDLAPPALPPRSVRAAASAARRPNRRGRRRAAGGRMSDLLRVDRSGPGDAVARVTLTRPEVHNAFNASLIAELRTTFAGLARQSPTELRAVVLAGDGTSFCAGADIDWMRAAMALDVEGNEQDAMAMADMFETLDTCPVPVIARVQGAALGGGMGLCAVADVVIAEAGARFGFTETRLGILPAVISPFVIAKIGESHARALFPGGRRFDAFRAQRIGLVHEVVEGEEALDAAVEAAGRRRAGGRARRRRGRRRRSFARYAGWGTGRRSGTPPGSSPASG